MKHLLGPLALATVAILWASSTPAEAADCNANGTDDAQDISSGTSLDCNTNGVPDECDLSPGSGFHDPAFWAAYDHSDYDGNADGYGLDGYRFGTFDGRYVYFAPHRNANGYHGTALRYDTQWSFHFSHAWEAFDAAAELAVAEIVRYFGAVFDGRFVYFVPDNHGRVLRYDTTAGFGQSESWSVFNATGAPLSARGGYRDGAFDGRYVYFVPYKAGSVYHGEVLRYDTQAEFGDSSSWSKYDPGANGVGAIAVGFQGAVFHDQYVYFVPYYDGTNQHGEVLRYDTTGTLGFEDSSSWSAYDPGAHGVGLSAKGFIGAVCDGIYVYFVPYHNDTDYHGEVLRYDTTAALGFESSSSWSAYDPGANGVGVDPDGYVGGVFDGRYVYFSPINNGSERHGEVLRYDTQGSFDATTSWDTFDSEAAGVGHDAEGYQGAVFDGRYVYFVPYIDDANIYQGEVLRFDAGLSTSPDCDTNNVPDECDGFSAVLYVDANAPGAADGSDWLNAFTDLEAALARARCLRGVITDVRIAPGIYKPWRPVDDANATFELVVGVTLRGGYAGWGAADPNERDITAFETVLSGDLNGDDDGFTNMADNSEHVVWTAKPGQFGLDGLTITRGNTTNSGGGGLGVRAGSIRVSDCTFASNHGQERRGAGLDAIGGDTVVEVRDCVFRQNQTDVAGHGAGIAASQCTARIHNSRFFQNNAADGTSGRGGAIYLVGGEGDLAGRALQVAGCTIFDNRASRAGGICVSLWGEPEIVNCTIVDNHGTFRGGGIWHYPDGVSLTTIRNCIVSGNTDEQGYGVEYKQVRNDVPGTRMAIYHSCIQGLDTWGTFDASNIGGADEAFPQFVDLLGLDLRLRATSPCIDAASNPAVPADTLDLDDDRNTTELLPVDVTGGGRFADAAATPDTGETAPGYPAVVDMGAFEHQLDCNSNGIPDDCDVSCAGVGCPAFDCGLRPDCNSNGIPDECDLAPGSGFHESSSWAVYDYGDGCGDDCTDPDGYIGAAFDGRYVYFVPANNGSAYHGEVLRYDTLVSFDEPNAWQTYSYGTELDGCDEDPYCSNPVGFYGAVFDGRYVYFVPYRIDNTTAGPHSEVLRYDTQGFFEQASSWTSFDYRANDGYIGAVFDGRYIYFAPRYNGNEYHGEVLRYDTTGDFRDILSWETFDAGEEGVDTDPDGYWGAVFDGRYVYFVPNYNGAAYHGEVLRYDTQADFSTAASWSTFDPSQNGVGDNPIGYQGAVTDGRYIYFVPFWRSGGHHGEVLRYDTHSEFAAVASWSTFDPGEHGIEPDPNGFHCAIYDGRYVYFVPSDDGSGSAGIVLRYDTTAEWSSATSWTTFIGSAAGPRGYAGGAFDGRHIYFAPYYEASSGFHGRTLRYDTFPRSLDCNSNGVPDECDIMAATSDDCSGNGVPDECEPDCNTNGVADSCDIFTSFSLDCQPNGIPDECEADCNTNGVPDDCDVRPLGASEDCQPNGIPDECETDCNTNGIPDDCDLATGTSDDCQPNEVPDECEADCNSNGVPDDCDLMLGRGFDDDVETDRFWNYFDPGDEWGGPNHMYKGYWGAVFDGRYVYFAPFNYDGEPTHYHGKVLRYDTQGLFDDLGAWAAYSYDTDPAGCAMDPDCTDPVGFIGAVFDGRYVYFVPYRDSSHDPHGEVLRYDTQGDFANPDSWDTYDRGFNDGYMGGVFDGQYVYFAPRYNNSGYHGEVLRYNTTSDFKAPSSWEKYDFGLYCGGTCIDPDGYQGAIFDGRFVYFVPNHRVGGYHSEVLRYDTMGDFGTASSWTTFSPAAPGPGMDPVGTDPVGYRGGTTDGRYIYFAPFNRSTGYHGEALRYDTQGPFESVVSWSTFDPENHGIGTDPDGYADAIFDGRYVYFVPSYDGDDEYAGDILRYDTFGNWLAPASWTTFSGWKEPTDRWGYAGGAYDGRYIYFAPWDFDTGGSHGRVLRFDTAAYAEDCNTNGEPDECDIGLGISADCNTNDIPDECDLADGTSEDCNTNGVPDECDLEEAMIDIFWAGTDGLWTQIENWCPGVVPNNGPAAQFLVTIADSDSVVTLDTSPTLEALSCLDDASLEVNANSGADVRFLASGTPIVNDGIIRAKDGRRLYLDASDINQTPDGVLEAIGQPGEASRIQIYGDTVTGGRVSTEGDLAAIELLGGAALVDVIVEGNIRGKGDPESPTVVVPDGRSGSLGGQITNHGGIEVSAQEIPTTLVPGPAGVTLTGQSSVKLSAEVLAWFGSTGRTITNQDGHRIEGAGILFGGFVNEPGGVIEANLSDQSLWVLSGADQKVNDGVFLATAGGILDVRADLTGAGSLQATDDGLLEIHDATIETYSLLTEGADTLFESCLVQLGNGIDEPPGRTPRPNGVLEFANSVVNGCDGLFITGGSTFVTNASTVSIANGPIEICPDTETEPTAIAELHVDAASQIGAMDLQVCAGGVLDVFGTLILDGALTFTNSDEGDWHWRPQSVLQLTGGVGLPPNDPSNYVLLEVGGADLGTDPENHVGNPAGFSENFELQTLVIGTNAHVALVDLADNDNRGGPGGPDEALYVEILRFEDTEGRLSLGGLHLYYNALDPPDALGQIIDCRAGEADCDGDVDLGDFAVLQQCWGLAPLPDWCRPLDLDTDGDLDLYDWADVMSELTGP